MEQNHLTNTDYRQYDRVWQRVAPDLEPYPGWQAPAASTSGPQAAPPTAPMQPAQSSAPTVPAVRMQPAQPAVPSMPAMPTVPAVPVTTPVGQLPGAIQDPCCMGSQAADMLGVITGFVEEELVDRAYFRALSRQAPVWARQTLRELSETAAEHAKRLMSAYYLITGQCYRPQGVSGPVYIQGWCQALRERYHTKACDGLNYARAADGTTDICLREMLTELSQESYQQARVLMGMLQKTL